MRHRLAIFLGFVLFLVGTLSAAAGADPTNTNDPAYWEGYFENLTGHEAACYTHEGDSNHGVDNGDGSVTLYPFNQAWPGDHWEGLVVKSGSVDVGFGPGNIAYVHPEAGVPYFGPLNAGGEQGEVSHWIACKGTTPPTTTTTTVVTTTTVPPTTSTVPPTTTTSTTTTTVPPTTTTVPPTTTTSTTTTTVPPTTTTVPPTTTTTSTTTTTVPPTTTTTVPPTTTTTVTPSTTTTTTVIVTTTTVPEDEPKCDENHPTWNEETQSCSLPFTGAGEVLAGLAIAALGMLLMGYGLVGSVRKVRAVA